MLIPPLPLLNFFVAAVMTSIGLRVNSGELLGILRNRALLTRTLLANCALIPAIGFLLIRIFPLTPDSRIGILLLAAIPGTPIALQFTRMAKTRLAFAAAMICVLSLVSIATTPLAIEVMPDLPAPYPARPAITTWLLWRSDFFSPTSYPCPSLTSESHLRKMKRPLGRASGQ